MPPTPRFTQLRQQYHRRLAQGTLALRNGIPTNADKDSRLSVAFAQGIISRLGLEGLAITATSAQSQGATFEQATDEFVRETFQLLAHLRPGKWLFGSQINGPKVITHFQQYQHLVEIERLVKSNPELAAVVSSDYLIKPDVIIARVPEPDSRIDAHELLVDETVGRLSFLRAGHSPVPVLHAMISCKWSIRSDRAQNARSEALNLVRNRKGHLPHISVVTAEPLPSRLASLALGTGDIDCVYHFALPELEAAIAAHPGAEDALEQLHIMVRGNRLKDIADLPLDLAV